MKLGVGGVRDKSLVELGRNASPLPPLSSAATVDSQGLSVGQRGLQSSV